MASRYKRPRRLAALTFVLLPVMVVLFCPIGMCGPAGILFPDIRNEQLNSVLMWLVLIFYLVDMLAFLGALLWMLYLALKPIRPAP